VGHSGPHLDTFVSGGPGDSGRLTKSSHCTPLPERGGRGFRSLRAPWPDADRGWQTLTSQMPGPPSAVRGGKTPRLISYSPLFLFFLLSDPINPVPASLLTPGLWANGSVARWRMCACVRICVCVCVRVCEWDTAGPGGYSRQTNQGGSSCPPTAVEW